MQWGAAEYRSGAPRPLAGYGVVVAVFAALVAGTVGLTFATRRRVPEDVRVRDLVLLTVFRKPGHRGNNRVPGGGVEPQPMRSLERRRLPLRVRLEYVSC